MNRQKPHLMASPRYTVPDAERYANPERVEVHGHPLEIPLFLAGLVLIVLVVVIWFSPA